MLSMSSPPTASNKALRAVLILLPAAAFVGLLAYGLSRTGGPPAPGDDAPAFEAELLEGTGDLSLADLSGKPVVLNFWASWCAPCRDEAPWFKAAYERFGDEVQFVGVDINDGRTEAIAFTDEYGIEYPVCAISTAASKVTTDSRVSRRPSSSMRTARSSNTFPVRWLTRPSSWR